MVTEFQNNLFWLLFSQTATSTDPIFTFATGPVRGRRSTAVQELGRWKRSSETLSECCDWNGSGGRGNRQILFCQADNAAGTDAHLQLFQRPEMPDVLPRAVAKNDSIVEEHALAQV